MGTTDPDRQSQGRQSQGRQIRRWVSKHYGRAKQALRFSGPGRVGNHSMEVEGTRCYHERVEYPEIPDSSL
jgi:hypothetical protein